LLHFILLIFASVLTLIFLLIIPLQISKNLLVKIAVICLLNAVLSYLVYSLFSFTGALITLFCLTIAFAVIVSKQDEFYRNPKIVKNEEVKPVPIQEPVVKPSEKPINKLLMSKLDQESIDALIVAAQDSEVDTDLDSNTDEPYVDETEEINVTSEEPLFEQSRIATSLEKTEDETEEDDLELIFEGRTRKLIIEADFDEQENEVEPELHIYDRGLMSEVENEESLDLDMPKSSKPLVKKPEDETEIVDSILKKRTRLFEEL
jgi:hypothetical protein